MTYFSSTQQHSRCNVAILAGGMGTRLSTRSGNLPKPMVPILGKPVLQHQIELCRKFGFIQIALLVHHHHEVITKYFGDGTTFGVQIHYVIEESPRGTAGALRDALPILDHRFFVLYGDTFLDVDLRRMWNEHISSGAVSTLFLHPNDHPQDSDLVEVDSQGRIHSILPYPHPQGREVRNLVNAALYVLDHDGLEYVTPIKGKADIAKQMFPAMLKVSKHLHGYVTPEYIKDMGTPERLDKVERDFVAGLPEKLSSRNLRTAVFIDRDGTLNVEVNHLKHPDQLKLLPGVAKAIRRLNRSGTLAVVVTNQPVVARGDITYEGLSKVHARLESHLGIEGAFVDGIYVCPHHPDSGFQGEVTELKVACECRKPKPGLIDLACRELNIDRRCSWMIGDTTSDIETARRAGVRSILLRTGYAGSDTKHALHPDYVCRDLPDAVEWILNGHIEMTRKMYPVAMTACNGKRLVLIGGLARAGKSFAAQVLKELLQVLGRTAHVVSLDGWLKPKHLRHEGVGVCNRYDLQRAIRDIMTALESRSRVPLLEQIHDRSNQSKNSLSVTHSIGPEDTLIVEGVPALLLDELKSFHSAISVFIDVSLSAQADRLAKDYSWRKDSGNDISNKLYKRGIDETPLILKTRNFADFIVSQAATEINNDRE
jgi:histidinol-phosphate phosphatase family protein